MKTVLVFLALFQNPAIELDGPVDAKPGQLVVLDSEAIPAVATSWLLVNPPPDDNHQIVDGRLFFATAFPGEYRFVFAFVADIGEGPPQIQQVLHTLTIEGKPPGPGPVVPDPILPDGQYRLATLSRAEALKLPSQEAAGTVAGVYRSVAAQVQAGALKGDRDILSETSKKLRDRLGEKFEDWKPWGIAISTRLSELYEEEKVKADEDFAIAYGEIALGLESLQ